MTLLRSFYTNISTTVAGTSYNLALSDGYNFVNFTGATPIILLVRNDSNTNFPINSFVFINQQGDGIITVTPESGVAINVLSTKGFRTFKNGICMLRKIADNTWVLSGDVME